MAAPLLEGGEALAPLHRQGIGLRAVEAQEAVPETVEAVRLKGGGHELVGVLIEQLVVDNTIGAAAPGAVEGHLEVLVVDGDLVVGELGVGVHTQRMGTARGVFQGQIPQLHALPPGDSPRRCG